MSKLRLLLVGFLFVLMIISITLPWRRIPEYNIETDYGLPFIWGTQILTEEALIVYPDGTDCGRSVVVTVSLAGVKMRETWRVNPTHLLLDILFWTGLMTVTVIFPTKMPKLRIPQIRVTIERARIDRSKIERR